ncbi:MAG: carbohydrate-binding domain-containing protein, partial [Clostridia bacterium]|nr:carbohydrate-binding domain-containing protein [Clostridia bacterium]
YYTPDLTAPDETNVSSAAARNSETGEIDTTGDGQINFVVVPAEGCTATVTATGNYKNLKTVAENAYRLTKVTGDVAVTITVAAAGETDTSDPVITFTDSAATLTSGSAAGVTINGTAVKINAAGTYTFTGSCADGSIVVKKGVTGVTLVLDGLTLSAHATAPITCNKGSGVTIVAAAGSVNNLADDQYNNDDYYTDETTYPDIENAVIKCKDGSNVTISGTGTINVNAYGKNGVKGGADLYEEDADGNYTDVLLSTASLTIQDVTLNVSIKHSYKDPEDATSYDGDAIKSEKALNILSGNITVSVNDDGIKCDYTLNIGANGTTGPTINVTKATEGIEGSVVNVYSGNIYVTASDDGINAANGDIAERSADFSYNQYGGYVYINVTNGDGIDSNGSANLAGGTLEVYAPSQGDGDPIDTEYGCTFGGATVLAVGHNAMMQPYSGVYVAFGSSSNGMQGGRPGFGGMGTAETLVTAGGTVEVRDADGNTLYTATAVRDASCVVFADPSLTEGGSYTLHNDSTIVSTASAVAGSGGNTGPGGNMPTPPENGERPTPPENGERPTSPENGEMPTPPENTDGPLPGDVNGDGKVNSQDARLALRAAAKLETLTEAQTAAADVNGDGKITSVDARTILRAAAKLEPLQAPAE